MSSSLVNEDDKCHALRIQTVLPLYFESFSDYQFRTDIVGTRSSMQHGRLMARSWARVCST